jgi:para-nitrobenzyl esterase
MPSLHLAEAHVAAGGTAYVYELTWPAPGLGGVLGACHGLDVPLVFGNLAAGQPAVLIGEVTEEATRLSTQMRGAWTSFANTGDPGWPSYDGGLTQVFAADSEVVPYPEQASRDRWPDHPEVLDLRA